ncbi:hypothetical protein H5410_046695 [Solanum commersonii]|uniref:Uncharacterized protein n=1 Tax=Solanum commersonii TaxID=4109 RepID=A0A9J5XF06_SOLCO|nr:hypothetical protein H5410_046695 [Solanum commersonii]
MDIEGATPLKLVSSIDGMNPKQPSTPNFFFRKEKILYSSTNGASIVSNFPIPRDRNNVVSSQNHMDSSIKIQNNTEQLKIWVPSNPNL